MSLDPGTRVCRKARCFDIAGTPRWSQQQFPTTWRTQILFGTVLNAGGRLKWRIRWDFDGDETVLHRNAFSLVDGTPQETEANDQQSDSQSDMNSDRSSDGSHGDGSDAGSDGGDAETNAAPLQALTATTAPVNTHPGPRVVGDTVNIGATATAVKWKKLEHILEDSRTAPKEPPKLMGIDISTSSPLQIFLHLFPFSVSEMISAINTNATAGRARSRATWRTVNEGEFLIWLAIFVSRAQMAKGSLADLWANTTTGLFPGPNYARFMVKSRFEEISQWMSVVTYSAHGTSSLDPWWKVRPAIDAFNANRIRTFHASFAVVIDELMSSYRGDGLPHLSFIKRKPEPVGSEFKCIADTVSGVMMALELQEGKLPMSKKEYHTELGATAACTKRMVKLAGLNGSSRVVIGDSWFASRKTCLALLASGVHFIGNVKTAHAFFPKAVITQDCRSLARGSHVVYEDMETQRVFAVGWKCGETKTTMTIVSTCGVTLPGSLAQVERQDEYGNASKVKYPRPVIAEIYQESAGVIDYHNRVRQGQLALEKKWITTRWDFRIFTTIFGICVTDTFLASRYFTPDRFSDHTPLDFVGALTKDMMAVGQGLFITNTPAVGIAELPGACVFDTMPVVYRTSKDNSPVRKQLQSRCGVCVRWVPEVGTGCHPGYG